MKRYVSRQSLMAILGHFGQSHLHLQEGHSMATKDKNTKKSMEKKPAQKTLKEKRQAKRAKK
jgi:hypothetical protein